jgi:hypothetical protein
MRQSLNGANEEFDVSEEKTLDKGWHVILREIQTINC